MFTFVKQVSYNYTNMLDSHQPIYLINTYQYAEYIHILNLKKKGTNKVSEI